MPGSPMPPMRAVPTVNVGKPINPLHSTEFLIAQMLNTGCYPEVERCTGRTTVLALRIIADAISNPHVEQTVRDHHPTTFSHQSLVKKVHDMTQALGLQHFKCNPSRLTVTFTNRA